MNTVAPSVPNLPWTIPVLENAVWAAVMALGAVILWGLGPWLAAAYLAYSLVALYGLIPRLICTSCAYYGRTCHSGQGRIAGRLFRKQDPATFPERFVNMRLAGPVFTAPLLAALIALPLRFSWSLVFLAAAFGVVALGITRLVTLRLGCARCAQREVCPAVCRRRGTSCPAEGA